MSRRELPSQMSGLSGIGHADSIQVFVCRGQIPDVAPRTNRKMNGPPPTSTVITAELARAI